MGLPGVLGVEMGFKECLTERDKVAVPVIQFVYNKFNVHINNQVNIKVCSNMRHDCKLYKDPLKLCAQTLLIWTLNRSLSYIC